MIYDPEESNCMEMDEETGQEKRCPLFFQCGIQDRYERIFHPSVRVIIANDASVMSQDHRRDEVDAAQRRPLRSFPDAITRAASIAIFDEAHNIHNSARSARTTELTADDLQKFYNHFYQRVLQRIQDRANKEKDTRGKRPATELLELFQWKSGGSVEKVSVIGAAVERLHRIIAQYVQSQATSLDRDTPVLLDPGGALVEYLRGFNQILFEFRFFKLATGWDSGLMQKTLDALIVYLQILHALSGSQNSVKTESIRELATPFLEGLQDISLRLSRKSESGTLQRIRDFINVSPDSKVVSWLQQLEVGSLPGQRSIQRCFSPRAFLSTLIRGMQRGLVSRIAGMAAEPLKGVLSDLKGLLDGFLHVTSAESLAAWSESEIAFVLHRTASDRDAEKEKVDRKVFSAFSVQQFPNDVSEGCRPLLTQQFQSTVLVSATLGLNRGGEASVAPGESAILDELGVNKKKKNKK
ncbi:MAG: hypothetical protein KDK37_18400, partial [Leptospiraceae bacterium]|nr:hypothetical protein [Leptospiraceae bacterium]